MSVLNGLFGPVNNLQDSLGRTSKRQSLLTENLANANVPGYKRKDMDFHITLKTASSKLSGSVSFSTDTGGTIRADGSSVDIEREITSLGETELHYSMLTALTSRYFGGLRNVIKEGR